MQRRVLYTGLGLIAIAVIIFIIGGITGSGLSTGFQNAVTVQNLTVKSLGFSTVTFNATAPAYFFMIASLSSRANTYLFNSTGFNSWEASISGNPPESGAEAALALEGHGAFSIYLNATNVTIPETSTQTTQPVYQSNQSQLYPPGYYYFVIDNSNGSISSSEQIQAKVLYLPPVTNSSLSAGPLSGIGTQIEQEAILGVVFFIFLASGIIVLLYGFIKKPKDSNDGKPGAGKPAKLDTNANKQYVDELYKNVDKKKSAKKGSA